MLATKASVTQATCALSSTNRLAQKPHLRVAGPALRAPQAVRFGGASRVATRCCAETPKVSCLTSYLAPPPTVALELTKEQTPLPNNSARSNAACLLSVCQSRSSSISGAVTQPPLTPMVLLLCLNASRAIGCREEASSSRRRQAEGQGKA